MTGTELARAKTMLDLRRYDEAARLLAIAVAADPDNSHAWCLLAAAQLGQGENRAAAQAADHAVALAPSNNWPHRLASMARVRLGDTGAAMRAATEACRLAPDQWRAHVCLAQAALATEVDFNLADRAAARARALAPNEPDVHFISGRVSLAREDRRSARALALDPEHSEAMNELGRLSLRFARSGRAAGHFLQAARSAPRVSAYGRNVEVVVYSVVRQTIYVASLASLALVYLTVITRVPKMAAVLWYASVAVLSIGFGVAQLRRMPRATWPLFRDRRIKLALGLVYGLILAAMLAVATAPASALTGVVLSATAAIIGSRFATFAILRPRRRAARTGAAREPAAGQR